MDDNIPFRIYPQIHKEIRREKGPGFVIPLEITRAWLDGLGFPVLGSQRSPVYYVEIPSTLVLHYTKGGQVQVVQTQGQIYMSHQEWTTVSIYYQPTDGAYYLVGDIRGMEGESTGAGGTSPGAQWTFSPHKYESEIGEEWCTVDIRIQQRTNVTLLELGRSPQKRWCCRVSVDGEQIMIDSSGPEIATRIISLPAADLLPQRIRTELKQCSTDDLGLLSSMIKLYPARVEIKIPILQKLYHCLHLILKLTYMLQNYVKIHVMTETGIFDRLSGLFYCDGTLIQNAVTVEKWGPVRNLAAEFGCAQDILDRIIQYCKVHCIPASVFMELCRMVTPEDRRRIVLSIKDRKGLADAVRSLVFRPSPLRTSWGPDVM